jgi:GT2 family glycosyltransferase
MTTSTPDQETTTPNVAQAAIQTGSTPALLREAAARPRLSIVIVSFNTRDLTRRCLEEIRAEAASLTHEILLVDNASRDGSAEMVAEEFPDVRLFRTDRNLGFGNANNVALREARGEYIVLLNSDAFMKPGALARAVEHMDANPACGLGGGMLVGREGDLQPSARMYHTVGRDLMVMTGLAYRFPKSRVFGSLDRTWADPSVPAKVDWVPGAFSIIRPSALERVGHFDPDFFLYYEEVDLCRRIQRAGFEIWYWPDVVVTHIGGESSRQLKSLAFSSTAAQVVLWRMRSTLLYYRKHHGPKVHAAYWSESLLYGLTCLRNRLPGGRSPQEASERRQHFQTKRKLLKQAWHDTRGGRVSPPQPW